MRSIFSRTLLKRFSAAGIIVVLYLLHQDFWFWRTARPLVLGFLPIGLFYHAAYTIATAVALWVVVKIAWPAHLETSDGIGSRAARGDGPPASNQ